MLGGSKDSRNIGQIKRYSKFWGKSFDPIDREFLREPDLRCHLHRVGRASERGIRRDHPRPRSPSGAKTSDFKTTIHPIARENPTDWKH